MKYPSGLTADQVDRAAGVLLGTAVGDALGVHYELATPLGPGAEAEMLGGGLGDFEPGEWSDDTSMAVVIAAAIANRAGRTWDLVLDEIVLGFVRWIRSTPPDVGMQTSNVLSRVAQRLDAGEVGPARIAAQEAVVYARSHDHSAGNGALMRTAPVALAYLQDRQRLAQAARQVAQLTHADPLAGDSCVLWCEAVRVAVLHGRADLTAGLDLLSSRRPQWTRWMADAIRPSIGADPIPGRDFRPNGYTVTALQAAMAAITHTVESPGQFEQALHAAIRIGDDTDTVAAIAGGLLGARWGATAIPSSWRRAVHGWPGYTATELMALTPSA